MAEIMDICEDVETMERKEMTNEQTECNVCGRFVAVYVASHGKHYCMAKDCQEAYKIDTGFIKLPSPCLHKGSCASMERPPLDGTAGSATAETECPFVPP